MGQSEPGGQNQGAMTHVAAVPLSRANPACSSMSARGMTRKGQIEHELSSLGNVAAFQPKQRQRDSWQKALNGEFARPLEAEPRPRGPRTLGTNLGTDCESAEKCRVITSTYR
jgi:hypothetical protein